MPARSIIYASDRRTEIGRMHGDNRLLVELDEVSDYFTSALLAREDSRFYYHFGVDPVGLARALVRDIKDKSMTQGASTLTMQLARNSFDIQAKPGQGSALKSLDRKMLEIALAFRIESHFSKKEILKHYVNRIFWGHNMRGVEAASRTYFEKSAKDLTLSEAAMLAGIIRGPNSFSPFRSIERATSERDTTLARMVDNQFITQAEADQAKTEKLQIRPEDRRLAQGSYAMDAIRRDLDLILEDERIDIGGLTIITTIDHNIQKAAERAMEKHLRTVERKPGYNHQTRSQYQHYLKTAQPEKTKPPKYIQGAAVVIENRSGAVLAVVGGRDADESMFNRAKYAKRQIGSIFKPFVYLTAFNNGMQAQTWIRDTPLRPGEIKGAQRSWNPRNSDGKYYKYVTAEEALIRSRNTSSVRVGDFARMDRVHTTANDVGFTQKLPNTPAAYLGSWEATPWQVASAYTIFPNNGERYRPYLIQEIRNGDQVLYRNSKLVYSAASRGAAWETNKVLQKVAQRGTGAAIKAKFSSPAAGKTGTTDNYQDAWFAGYTTAVTCSVWVGMDQPQRTIDRGYGSTLALPIWIDIIKEADEVGYAAGSFNPPMAMKQARLCRWSAKRATKECEKLGSAYTTEAPADTLPGQHEFCPFHPSKAQPVNENKRAPRAIPVR